MYDHYEVAFEQQNRLGRAELGTMDRALTAETVTDLAATLESDVAAVMDSTARLIEALETDERDERAFDLFDELSKGVALAIATGYRIQAAVGFSNDDVVDKALSAVVAAR
jgi:hypothetical protein